MAYQDYRYFSQVNNLFNRLYHSKILGAIFHTLSHCLQRELKDCESVLDIGCGPSSPLQHCKNIKYSIGVEAFEAYLKESEKKKIHTEYIGKKIEEVDFPENSFDAVIMIEILEHLQENMGLEILKKAEKWAKKKIIVSSPNGFIPQKELDNNPLQKHLSGWDFKKLKKLGFKIYGLGGLKFLWQELECNTMSAESTQRIRFNPKFFWFIIATLSQLLTYYVPLSSFELFSIKNKYGVN